MRMGSWDGFMRMGSWDGLMRLALLMKNIDFLWDWQTCHEITAYCISHEIFCMDNAWNAWKDVHVCTQPWWEKPGAKSCSILKPMTGCHFGYQLCCSSIYKGPLSACLVACLLPHQEHHISGFHAAAVLWHPYYVWAPLWLLFAVSYSVATARCNMWSVMHAVISRSHAHVWSAAVK